MYVSLLSVADLYIAASALTYVWAVSWDNKPFHDMRAVRYLSHCTAAKAHTSLCKCTDSQEPFAARTCKVWMLIKAVCANINEVFVHMRKVPKSHKLAPYCGYSKNLDTKRWMRLRRTVKPQVRMHKCVQSDLSLTPTSHFHVKVVQFFVYLSSIRTYKSIK